MARPIDDIAAALQQALSAAIAEREDELTRVAEAGGSKAGGGLLGDIGALTDVLGTFLELALITDPPAEAALQVVKGAESAGGHLGRGFGIGYMLGYAGWQMVQPAVLPLQYKFNTIFQTQQMDPDVSARWVTQNILALQDGRNKAHEVNVSDDNFDKWVDSLHARPAVGELLELMNRGEVEQADVETALQRLGYDPFWIPPLLSLHRSLLSPADLALGLLRGHVDQTTADGYIQQLGITPDDFTVLVDNTGEPPGLMQMLEAYRRGFMDKDRLERGIKQSRVRDEWIDIVEALRYEPMSTADAVRAVVEGHITDDEGKSISQQNGLEPEHWQILVDAWGRPPSHEQMLTLYHRGQATLDQVKQAILESDIKNKYVDQLIELGRTLIAERQLVSMVDHGVIGHDDAITHLLEHGYTQADAELLINLGAAQRTTAHKLLTKGDIVAMYTDRLMNRDQAVTHLKALGYSDTDASQMLDLADYKAKASQLKTFERGLEASFKSNHVTESEAIAQLTTRGLDHSQAQMLVDEWKQERRIPTRTLTEKQIADATWGHFITLDQARVKLKALGLSDEDTEIYIKLQGMDNIPPPSAPTTPAAPA